MSKQGTSEGSMILSGLTQSTLFKDHLIRYDSMTDRLGRRGGVPEGRVRDARGSWGPSRHVYAGLGGRAASRFATAPDPRVGHRWRAPGPALGSHRHRA